MAAMASAASKTLRAMRASRVAVAYQRASSWAAKHQKRQLVVIARQRRESIAYGARRMSKRLPAQNIAASIWRKRLRHDIGARCVQTRRVARASKRQRHACASAAIKTSPANAAAQR